MVSKRNSFKKEVSVKGCLQNLQGSPGCGGNGLGGGFGGSCGIFEEVPRISGVELKVKIMVKAMTVEVLPGMEVNKAELYRERFKSNEWKSIWYEAKRLNVPEGVFGDACKKNMAAGESWRESAL
jgi:hypothetical protein